MTGILYLFFVMGFLVGFVLLQIFLSKKENNWLGLILPIISFIFSIMTVLGFAIFQNTSTSEIIVQEIFMFVLWNIPTICLIAIYFACRESYSQKKAIDKMNIEDLE